VGAGGRVLTFGVRLSFLVATYIRVGLELLYIFRQRVSRVE